MEDLNLRLEKAFNVLVERNVFLAKYNIDVYHGTGIAKQLQLCTNFLSTRDINIIASVCELFSLSVSINECPSTFGYNISVIFEGKSNG